jgi:hypothetical protein
MPITKGMLLTWIAILAQKRRFEKQNSGNYYKGRLRKRSLARLADGCCRDLVSFQPET